MTHEVYQRSVLCLQTLHPCVRHRGAAMTALRVAPSVPRVAPSAPRLQLWRRRAPRAQAGGGEPKPKRSLMDTDAVEASARAAARRGVASQGDGADGAGGAFSDPVAQAMGQVRCWGRCLVLSALRSAAHPRLRRAAPRRGLGGSRRCVLAL